MRNCVKRLKLKGSILSFIVLLLCMSGSVFAQSNKGTISGFVNDDNGKALPYATVAVKGTDKGTVTNMKGHYSLELAAGDYTIVFSFTGYHALTKTIAVKAGETEDLGTVSLESTNQILNEVQVDGMIHKFAEKKTDMVARMPLKNLENPQVYTIVPKELFEEQVDVDFKSALATAPGVSNVTLGIGSGGTGLAMHVRGFKAANGAGAIRNGMATNWVSLSDPANLERIEIIKGPSATLFGSTLTSYGGLVNRVTKKAYNGTGTSIAFNTGSDNFGRFTVDYNKPLNDDGTFLFRFNGAVERQNSFQDYGKNKTTFLAPTFTYHVSDRLTLDFDGEYFESHRNTTYLKASSTTSYDNLNDLNWNFNRSYSADDFLSSSKVINILTKATYKISDKWTSTTALSYSSTENEAYYLFLVVADTDSLTRQIMTIPSSFNTIQVQQNFVGNFKIGSFKNRLLLGLDYTQLYNKTSRKLIRSYDKLAINTEDDNLNTSDVLDEFSTMSVSNLAVRDRKTYSVYGSDVINFTNDLIGMVSLRLDDFHDDANDYSQTTLSPKFGLIYQIVNDKVSLFGNYMNGFSNVAPATTEDSPETEQDMKPERANQLEGGVKFQLLKGKLNGTLSYYNIKVEDIVRSLTDANDETYSIQDGTKKSNGFEADLIANPVKGMHIIMGYGYNNSLYEKVSTTAYNGNHPYSTPKHVANFWVSHRLTKGAFEGFGIGLGGNYQSDSYLNDANTITVPGFFKMDGTVFFEKKAFRLGLKFNNITNKKYWMADYYAHPQQPRNFILNFTMRF